MKKIKKYLILSALLAVGCEQKKITPTESSCMTSGVIYSRTTFVDNIKGVVIARTLPPSPTLPNPPVNYHIRWDGTDTILGGCNLPDSFKKDSLKILVSGYFLTFPGMELMNLAPLPFEVTTSSLRE